ncbi:sensor histidine kinase [Gordonia sp. (in: high G+C Gram-positive bacteria)]|uniref:sensor histidine kinase n=1 Tax=Gordonia sp. (in: high G+C Gram-positive bacteria) TaxID=84139 RepID=UPI003F985666
MKRPSLKGVARVRRMSFAAISLVPDPTLRRYLGSGWNWLAMVGAVTMIAVTWPNLAMTHPMPAYLLPLFAVIASVPIALIFAGTAAVRAGWAMVIVTGSVASFVPHPGVDFPMPIPMFLVLFAMTVAALITQPLSKLPVVAAITAGALVIGVAPGARLGWIFALVVATIGVAFVRYRLSSQKRIEEQTIETETAQAREAVLAERTRIARELHDVVAHRMSMVVVMSQTAKYRLAAGDAPETVGPATEAEFTAIADAARQSLDEVRQLLGVLRPADAPSTRPVQGIDDLPGLVAQVRAAGVTVEYADRVADWGDPGAAGAAVFRIVQESLTNAARHAPGASVVVRIVDADGGVVVSVVNGPPADPDYVPQHGGGHGLVGMAERASAVGGTFTSQATPAGGFAVTATVPLRHR